jgi:hypothetical protein
VIDSRVILLKLRNWYRGEYVPPPPIDDGSGIFFLSTGSYRKSTSARIATVLVEFWRMHWQFLVGAAISIAGVIVAYTALGHNLF